MAEASEPIPPDPEARPLSVTAAAFILLAVATFAGLIGLVLLVVVMVNSNPATLPDYIDAAPEGFAGVAGAIGLGLAVYGLAGAVAAVQALRRRSWARWIGIVLTALGVGALVVAHHPARSGERRHADDLRARHRRVGVRDRGVGQ